MLPIQVDHPAASPLQPGRALLLAILGVVPFTGLTSPIAIVIGRRVLRDARARNDRGAATTAQVAIALGVLGIVMLALFLFVVISTFA